VLVTFHEDAQSDLQDAVFYYEARMVGLGLNLFFDVEDAVALIGSNPEACPLIGKAVRRIVLRRYPYSIIYAVDESRIRILAVAHHRRRPAYWRCRTEVV
jgi:plasmid stabilization system protein ParE